MAGGQERILRGRIRSVEATKKITRAFELIAASQIVRAQGRITGSRPYIEGISGVLAETAADSGNPSRLLGVPESPQNVLVIAVVADRGLCGGYNTGVLRTTERLLRAGTAEGRSYRVVAVGKKAQSYFRYRNQPVEHQFNGMTDRPSFEDARAVAKTVVRPFLDEEVDLVQVVSTRFVSAGRQVVETRQLLPLLPTADQLHHLAPGVTPLMEMAEESGVTGAEAGVGHFGEAPEPKLGYYEFEPDAEQLLERLIPQYVEASIYGTLLEASASEHTARQRAMSAATENADELIKTLRRVMNRARQDSITTEIMEIVGGAEALRSSAGGHTEFTHPRATEEQTA